MEVQRADRFGRAHLDVRLVGSPSIFTFITGIWSATACERHHASPNTPFGMIESFALADQMATNSNHKLLRAQGTQDLIVVLVLIADR